MRSSTSSLRVPLLVVVLASLLAGCDCRPPAQCSIPAHCEGRPWQHPNCGEDEGHWECQLSLCVETCDAQCDVPADCADEPWPDGMACDAVDRAWTCAQGTCEAFCVGDGTCSDYTDCDGLVWPEPSGTLDCDASQGHWECPAGECVAACNEECDLPAACTAFPWEVDCLGHWDCVQGLCEPTCDEAGCGDGSCDVEGGETAESCPDDCSVTCGVPGDCVDLAVWDEPCEGRWSCEVDACVPTCDYSTCGDGTCDPTAGEDANTCIVDCFDTCQWPTDCTHESWSQICQGRHTCFLGACQQTCDANGCGNGTCDAANGETADSCFQDCLGGPCTEATDCGGYRWYDSACPQGGHWACTAAGACEASCESVTCGDGSCDPLAGESSTSCPADCQEYDCQLTEHCDPLPVPAGCSGFLCVDQNCSPVCP